MLPNQMPIIKKTWSTRTKVLIGLGIAVLLAILTSVVAFYTADQPGPIQLIRGTEEPEVEILTTTDEAKPGDIFGVDVKVGDDKEITSIKFYVDGKLQETCEGQTECSFTSGPFSVDDIGGHKYETEFNYSDGTSYTKSGTFSVNENSAVDEGGTIPEEVETSEPVNAPQIKYFYTSNNYLSEGGLLVASLAVEKISEVDYLNIKIDGEAKKVCPNSSICSLSFTIPKNFNIGKHIITGEVVGTNGLISYTSKNFYIVEETTPPKVYVSPSISISPSKTQANPNETIKFSINVDPGSKTLVKSQINVGLTVVQECSNNSCSYTGGPYPQFAGLSVPYHAVAYFTDGTYISTGLQTVKIKANTIPDNGGGSQPQPGQDEPADQTDTELPTITIKSNKVSMFNTDEAIIIAQASDNEAVSEIMIFVDSQIVKTCKNVTTCSTVAGPYLNLTESKTILYGAYAFDSSGNDNWSGYSSMQVNIPEQIEEPTLELHLNKNVFSTDESVSMFATVHAGSKIFSYLNIWFNGFALKACYEDCTINSTLTSKGGQTIPIFVQAVFTDGTILTTETQTITVNAPEVPTEPTVNLSLNKNSVSEGEGFNMTATVNTAGKTTTQIKITNNSNTIYHICNNATTCVYDASSKPWTAGVHPFRAIATFSDGTVINSELKTINVFAGIEPTIEINKDKEEVTVGEQFNVSATVNPGSKSLSKLEIYDISNTLQKTCNSLTCTYTVGPFDQTGLITFQAEATFTDNSTLKSDLLFTTVYPNATPSVSISKDIESVVVGDIVNLTASVKPANKTISKLEVLDSNDQVLKTCDNSLTCTYAQNHSLGGILLLRKARATFTDNSTVLSINLSYFVGFPITPTIELTKDKASPIVGDTVNITATVNPSNKTISKIEIKTPEGSVLKTCNNVLSCVYTVTHNIGGLPAIYQSKATFTDNSTVSSFTLFYNVGFPAEPTIELTKDIETPVAGDTVNITATVEPSNKTISKVEISRNITSNIVKTCYSPTCTYQAYSNSGGISFDFQAKVTFTDGSILSTQTLHYVTEFAPEPTIDISFAPLTKTVGITASQNCTISSTVDPSNKTISYHRIYTESGLKKTCYTEDCSYSATASTMLGYTPARTPGTLSFYSSVVFTDGTSKMVQGNPITVTGD